MCCLQTLITHGSNERQLQGSLFYPFGGNETIQFHGNFQKIPINDALFGLVIYNDPWTRIPFDLGFEKDLCLQHVFLGCFKLGSFFVPNHAWISQNLIWNQLDGFLLFDIHAAAAFWTDSRRGWNTGMCVSGDFVPILLRSQSILIYYVLKLQESKGDYWNLPLMSGSD